MMDKKKILYKEQRYILKNDLEEKKHSPKKLDFSEFAGMWKDHNISLETIRKNAWK